MEFKLFGPGGSPSDHFQSGLKGLLDLDDQAWEVLASWFLTTTDFDFGQASSSPAIVASALLPEQFREGAPMFLSTSSNPGAGTNCSCRRSNATFCS